MQTQNIFDSADEDEEADGVLLYLSVRFKKEFRTEAERSIREILRKVDPLSDDFNNNAGKRTSPDGKMSDDSGIRGDTQSDQDGDEPELKSGRLGKNRAGKMSSGYIDADGNFVDGFDEDGLDEDDYEEYEEEIVGPGEIFFLIFIKFSGLLNF